jgi:polyisoprenoid-binding protein YceI
MTDPGLPRHAPAEAGARPTRRGEVRPAAGRCRAAASRLVGSTILLAAVAAHAGEWQVDRQAKENQVRFTSTVSSFSFEGATRAIDGFIYWEGDRLFERNTRVHFEVDLNALDSGIGKRDRDMQEVLQTDRWPKAVFVGQIVASEPTDSTATTYRGRVKGRLSLHGVEREIEVPGTVAVEGDRRKLVASFTLQLSEYGIQAPSLVAFVKVAQEVAVDVSFYLKLVP